MSVRFIAWLALVVLVLSNQFVLAIDPITDKLSPARISSVGHLASTEATRKRDATVLDYEKLASNRSLRKPGLAPFGLESSSELSVLGDLPGGSLASIREVYVWAWPLVYMSNLKQSMQLIKSPGRSGGAPVAPVNHLCMLTDVVAPEFNSVPCPNRDVIYGFGLMDLQEQPVVVQIPDFGDRFWLYQIGDHRMESIGELGAMYDTPAGFAMVVGPNWQGTVPETITHVIRSHTNLAYILPRVLVGHSDEPVTTDAELQEVLRQIAIYPLSKFNGQMKHKDWRQVRWYPALGRTTRERNKLVRPETFFDDLQRVLAEIEATPAEQPLAELAEQLVNWAKTEPARRATLGQLAVRLEQETIEPMFDFSHSGQVLPGHWRSVQNGAAFGDDYWSRTAVAKSNPFVNREQEAKYYYLEHSANGQPLQGEQAYTLHFAADQLPPADGFWSLTLYNAEHQLHANAHHRYSIGSFEQLKRHEDGSLTIVVQPGQPDEDANVNWLPSPNGSFKLYLRLYQPKKSAMDGSWTPPGLAAE